MAGLAAGVPLSDLLRMQVMTDAALLWVLLRHRLAAGGDPAAALGGLVTEVLAAAPGSRLTTLLTDGQRSMPPRSTHALCPPLGSRGAAGQRALRRRPGWQPIPDGHLVLADRGGVRYHPLPLTADR